MVLRNFSASNLSNNSACACSRCGMGVVLILLISSIQ